MMWTEDGDQFDKTNPGCISGIFHALHHQYWHSNVKKIIPHRSHKELIKHAKRNRRYKRVSDDEDSFEVLKLFDPETSHILVDKSNRKINSTQKRSLKARIKALVSEEQDQEVVPSPRLQRTYSVHHSESNEWVHPIIFFPENVNNESPSNVTNPESKDSRDVLEMFEVDKDLFTNILQEVYDTKPKLTKSGSFPSSYRNLKPTTLKDKLNEFYTKSKSKKLDSLNSNNDMRIKRASSLNESTTDRYARLFDFNVGNEAVVLRASRSLKLMKGSDNFFNLQEPGFLTRNHSLAHEKNPVSFTLGLNSIQDYECLNLNELVDKSDNLSENEHSTCPQEEEIQSNFHILEGPDLACNSQENIEKEIEIVNINKQIKPKSSRKQYQDDDDFTYVKQILERSGFMKNGFQQTWYSSNQPLDPFVFQEIESEYVHNPENFVEELNELSHRLLIFELVDDILLTMYERSLTYFPKALSSLCHIRPAPNGPVIHDEVWKCVSKMVEFKPDMNQSLDYIVSRDLGSDDGWMNLQLDSECVALDLEDLILDDILEELLCECS
ncbi:hypothetical protein L2E82_20687 [Cichorium intybus]|uniref:Uncharacterized protein n=1 Tax=Cichorium intybus TaxID=13427 RepID=A0ACB9DUT3_CICIN|nr:hypothetical protein L2E82_20687 [Cichorium intybus]